MIHAKLQDLQFFKDADRVISSQLCIDLGNNTFLRWRYIHCSYQKSMVCTFKSQ